MIKAATTSLSLALLCGAFSCLPISAQTDPSGAAVAAAEAARKQAQIIELRMLLDEAAEELAVGELEDAARRYERAYIIVEDVGVDIEPERDRTIAGLVETRLQIARLAMKRADLAEAEIQVDRVLRVAPRNAEAQKLKQEIDERQEALRGKVASPEVVQQLPEALEESITVATLVQDARLLIEMGKLKEAEAKLMQAIKARPQHQAAFYYLNLIKEARTQQESRRREITSKQALVDVTAAWNEPAKRELLPEPNPFARTNTVHTGTGRQIIHRKLDSIILDEVLYDGLPLSEVVKNLSEESRARDPEKKGINFLVNPYADLPQQQAQAPQFDPFTGQPLPAAPVQDIPDLNNVIVRLTPALRDVTLGDVLKAIQQVAELPVKHTVEDYAVIFTYRSAEAPLLFTRTFRVDPNTFLQGLENVSLITVGIANLGGGGAGGGGGGLGGGGGGGFGGGGGGGGLGGGGGGLGGAGGTGGEIPRVMVAGGGFGGGGLGGGGGGGFGGGGLGGGGLGGGGGGQGLGGAGLNAVTRLTPMSQTAQIVREFFTAAGIDFATNQVGGGLIGPAGVPAPPSQQKAIFFNDRTGVLFVRATLDDLAIIEEAVQALNVAPPQVTIETKFTEISQSDSKALGFDWFLGNFLMGGGDLGMQGGTAPTFSGSPSPANPIGTFPGFPAGVDAQNPLGTAIPISGSDQHVTGGLRNSTGTQGTIPAVASITGILTDPQFRVVIRALEQRSGVDVLSAPKITTLSGRQAQVQVTELKTIVSGQGFNQAGSGAGGLGGGGLGGGGAGFGQAGGAVTAASQFATQPVPLGPTLDVIPYVSADGYSVQMTIIPTITEFLGYDDPGDFVPQAQSAAGNTLGTPITAQLPLPRMRVRQLVTSAIVWDGQTVVLGGLISEDVAKFKDKVPVLGDIPLIGRFFRSESMATTKKNLVVFVTPTIIDPAGNRIHTDDNLPYDPATLPVQPELELGL